MDTETKILELKNIIESEVILRPDTHKIVAAGNQKGNWIFDFRKIFLRSRHINLIADIFWQKHEHIYPFQVGGLETASIPLITAIVMKGHFLNKPINGFYIRKTRKSVGLQNNIEGTLDKTPVILVDDLINFGNTFLRQIKVLEDLNIAVTRIFTLVRFRAISEYSFLTSRNISLESVFSLSDFSLTIDNELESIESSFVIKYRYKTTLADFFFTAPKSMLSTNDKYIYLARDDGSLVCLDHDNLQKRWDFSPTYGRKLDKIFFYPTVYGEKYIFFTGHNHTLYLLNSETGEPVWKFDNADKITSTATASKKHNLLFIGVQSGIFWKKGALIGLDIENGNVSWEYPCKNKITSQSIYIEKSDLIIFGDETGLIHCVNVKTKKEVWKSLVHGMNISSFLFFDMHKIAFGTQTGFLFILDTRTGEIIGKVEVGGAIWNTPILYEGNIYFSSSDKGLYSFSVNTGKLNWIYDADSRIFSSPTIFKNELLVGTATGKVLTIGTSTGKKTSEFLCSEGIVDKILISGENVIVPTTANEVYLLSIKTT